MIEKRKAVISCIWMQIIYMNGQCLILEVDTEYPEELHYECNDHPLAPENQGRSGIGIFKENFRIVGRNIEKEGEVCNTL